MKRILLYGYMGMLMLIASCGKDEEEPTPVPGNESEEFMTAKVSTGASSSYSFDANLVQYQELENNANHLVTGSKSGVVEVLQFTIVEVTQPGTYIIPALGEGKSRVGYTSNSLTYISGMGDAKDSLIVEQITPTVLKGRFAVTVTLPDNTDSRRIRGSFNVKRTN